MIAHRWKLLYAFWLGLLLVGSPAHAQKSNAEALLKEADNAFNQGYDSGKNADAQTEIAIDRLEFAVAADPQSLIARLQLAYLYSGSLYLHFRQNKAQTDFILKTYQDALAGDPRNPVLLWDMAVVEFQAHQFDEARDWMKRFLAVDLESVKGNIALAQIAVSLVDKPIRSARATVRSSGSGPDPVSDSAVRTGLGRKFLPQINEGIDAAQKALSLKADEVQALMALRELLYMKSTVSDPAAAIKLSSEIANLEPRIDAALEAQKAAATSNSGPGPFNELPRLKPDQSPPPLDASLVKLPPPPPPPPPPSAGPKSPEPPYKDLGNDDHVIETRDIPAAVHPNRALVLWMYGQTKHDRGPLKPDKPYTCQEHSTGSYYQGQVFLSLADTKTRTFLNTIALRDPAKYGTDDYDFKLPYRIAPNPYRVKGELKEGEGTPEFLHLEDYNGDGQPLEVALFNAKDCVETQATILGYGVKQDKAIRYRFILEKDEAMGGGYRNLFWIANLFSQKSDEPGHWKYEIDRRATDGFVEVIDLRYDPAQEIFRGKVSKK